MNDELIWPPDFDTWFTKLCTGEPEESCSFSWTKEQMDEFTGYMKIIKLTIENQNDFHNRGRYVGREGYEQVIAILRELHHNLFVKQMRILKRQMEGDKRRARAFPPPRLVQ